MKERIKYPRIKCNHEITKFPFCNKCCCIYDSNKKIASINKRLNSLIKEINFGNIYKNIVIQEENKLKLINKINSKYIYIKNRKEIIEKFFKVITIYKYGLSTFYLAIFLMDEIFYKVNLYKKYFLTNEEIALGSLFLAIKSLELENNISPNLSKIQSFFSPSISYSNERLKIIEILCLKQLDYNIYRITPYDYLNLFIKIGVIFSNEIIENSNLNVVYLNSNISKLSYEILDSLIKNTNEYFKIKPYLIALGIILYAKEKIMHCNNIEMFIYAYNISEEEIIKCKNFIKENSERKNKINERNNNKEDNLLSKRKNNKSQSPLKNQYYKLKKSFLIRPSSLSSVSSRPSSMKKSSLGSNVSTSSDDINNVNMNPIIKISVKNYSKDNSIDFSYSYTAQNTINSKRNKNLIKIRPLSQISEMRKSNILVNNKKLSNLNEVKSNLSQKINKHRLSIKEMLKENEKKKNNYASIELSYLISQTSNKSIYTNNKKKNINIKPFKFYNNNLEKKQKEKGNYKKSKINNVLKSTINLNKKINKRTHSLTTSVSREKKYNLNLIPLPKKNLINYCKFVNQKTKIL